MRNVLAIVMVLGALGGAAQANQKAAPAGGRTNAAGVKTPPLPPQLDETLWADASKAQWAPVASLPKGAQGALIGTDANNGGMAGWLKFPAGYHLPAVWETHIVTYTIISGQLTITSGGQKHALGPGSYAVLNSKDKHEMHCAAGAECVLIVHHLGPPDMHWVNAADAPKTH